MSSTKFCQLCLETEALRTFIDANRKCGNLTNKVIYCLDIKMEEEELSNMICINCIVSLNKFYKFKRKCHKVHRKLKNELQKAHFNKTKDETENHTINSSPDLSSIALKDYEQLSESSDEDIGQTENTQIDDSITEADLGLDVDFQSNGNNRESKAEGCSPEHNPYLRIKNTKNKSVQCDICGKIYKNKAVLKKHLLTHTGVKLYSCKLCPKQFTRAEHEVVHMRAHRGIKPFICEVCARGFTKRQDLQRHMKIHSDQRQFSCPQCGRRFKRSGDVHSHMRSHTGQRPYVCAVCHKGYSSHSGLKKHATSCTNFRTSAALVSVA